jgi:hypothetical protein
MIMNSRVKLNNGFTTKKVMSIVYAICTKERPQGKSHLQLDMVSKPLMHQQKCEKAENAIRTEFRAMLQRPEKEIRTNS